MNRLARERSPYLLQHKDNPVDWFPWGRDAFDKARAEDKPIFLSIGYSTCHWCHVMEHESFENDAVATVLNDNFVAIKVDREERPDVDRVYMTFVQATTGSGGWPMSVWLTPDLKPFYGGTYFPPESRWGRPGFTDILGEIARVWRVDREKVAQSADSLTERLHSIEQAGASSTVPGADALERTTKQFKASFDPRLGGFGDAPKFPRPSELLFLLREHARTGDPACAEMSLRTLRAMALGGMRDHVGGGFHRYSVDAAWRVPHFEKMLYDQAQLALAYLEATQASGDPFYAEVAEDTLRYVMREMTDVDGGFYSAEDADSEVIQGVAGQTALPGQAGRPHKAEGAFYLWTEQELDGLLADEAAIVKRRFGVEPNGNAPSDPQQEFVGKNLLYVARSVDDLAQESGRGVDEIVAVLERARLRMFQERLQRPRPQRDDKVLTAWNGLMIAAFARMSRQRARLQPQTSAGNPYLDAAKSAASFLFARMWDAEKLQLLRRYRGGHAEIEAYAEDYAYLIFGLVELFQADPDVRWLEWAIALQRRQDELFWDDERGGWFSTTGQDPSVLLRMKEDYDGAEPTASSISVLNLIALTHLVEDERWQQEIEKTLAYFGERLSQFGRAVPMMAAALSTTVAGVRQIVIVGEPREPLADLVAGKYLPFSIVLSLSPARQLALAERMPAVAGMRTVGGALAAAYVCEDFTCRAPVTTADALSAQLARL